MKNLSTASNFMKPSSQLLIVAGATFSLAAIEEQFIQKN
jgi:hypothetical protein